MFTTLFLKLNFYLMQFAYLILLVLKKISSRIPTKILYLILVLFIGHHFKRLFIKTYL